MEVFITCPSQRDRDAIAGLSGYNFHLLDAPLNPRTPSPELDLLTYIDQCRDYIRRHHIDAIFYSRDVADLVAAALCEEFGFPGPSVEAVFLCLHKYYGRRAEPEPRLRAERSSRTPSRPSARSPEPSVEPSSTTTISHE